jgi:hypothetical protein
MFRYNIGFRCGVLQTRRSALKRSNNIYANTQRREEDREEVDAEARR